MNLPTGRQVMSNEQDSNRSEGLSHSLLTTHNSQKR